MSISRVFRMVSGIALGLATCVGMSGQTAPTTKGEATHMSIQEVHVQRVNIVTTEPFDTVVYERTWAPGFHDLMFGILRDAGIVPNVTQTAGEVPTLISLVHSRMGI